MDIRECSLTDDARNAIGALAANAVATPWLKRDLYSITPQRIWLGEQVLALLPQETQEALDAMLKRRDKLAVIFSNLPEVPRQALPPMHRDPAEGIKDMRLRQRLFERRIISAEEATAEALTEKDLYFSHIMTAIYAAYGRQPADYYNPLLVRGVDSRRSVTDEMIVQGLEKPRGLKEVKWVGRYPHRDGFGFSAITVLRNYERAAFRIIDVETLIAELPASAQKNIILTAAQGDLFECAPALLRESGKSLNVNREASDPQALKLYDEKMAEHSKDILLDYGKAVLFPNDRFYHQAMQGEYEITRRQGWGRVTLNVSTIPNAMPRL